MTSTYLNMLYIMKKTRIPEAIKAAPQQQSFSSCLNPKYHITFISTTSRIFTSTNSSHVFNFMWALVGRRSYKRSHFRPVNPDQQVHVVLFATQPSELYIWQSIVSTISEPTIRSKRSSSVQIHADLVVDASIWPTIRKILANTR